MSEPLVTYAPHAVAAVIALGVLGWLAWRAVRWLDRESRAALDAIADEGNGPKDGTSRHPEPHP